MELGRYARYNPAAGKNTFPFFTLSESQRLRHVYVIGKTGTGKSTAFINWAIKDIRAGHGCVFIDPHGQDAETLLSLIPANRRRDVVLFAPHEFPIAFNVLDNVPPERRAFVATSIVDTFKSVFNLDFTASNIEMFIKAAILVLLENPGSTLLGLNYMLTSPTYRKRMLRRVTNPVVRDFWEQTFQAHMTDKEQRDRTISTISKIFQLITDPAVCNCIGQEKSAFDFANIISKHKIFIASLPQGELGTQQTAILGSFILSRLHTAAQQRREYTVFPVYIDEFQEFSCMVIRQTFAPWRKLGMTLILSHHYLSEVDEKLRNAIFGTAGTAIAFTLSAFDAETIAKLFAANIKPDDLIKLPPFRAVAAVEGGTVDLHMPNINTKRYASAPLAIRRNCISHYSRPAPEIEAEIAAFVASTQPRKKTPKLAAPIPDSEPVDWSP
jgi:type IV secretory pathway TraG/TraD family ATPase VirD4